MVDIETLRKEIVELRNENKGYLKQLQDGTLSETIASSCIDSNNRQIDVLGLQVLEKEKQITKLTKQDSGLGNLFITVVLALVWAIFGKLVGFLFSWPVGWTQTEINLCDGLFLFLHLVGSNTIVQLLTGGIRWGGAGILEEERQQLLNPPSAN